MKSFRKAHEGLKVQLAEGVKSYEPNTVYVVFLSLDVIPPTRPVEIVTESRNTTT